MNFFKMATLAVVAGAGLALAGTPVFAQSAGTSTSSSVGAGSSVSTEGAASTEQNSFNATSGTATSTSSTDPFTTTNTTGSTAGNVSINATLSKANNTSNTDGTTTNAQIGNNIAPSAFGGPNGSPGIVSALDGGGTTSNNDTTGKTKTASLTVTGADNGHSVADSFTKGHLWIDHEAHEGAHANGTSTTSATGDSMAALFVFGQTNVVNADSKLVDKSGQPDVVYVSTGDFSAINGTVALNQVAGVANQQGNTLATALELSGSNGTDAGSNTSNVENAQTLINSGVIKEANKSASDTAYIQTNAFQNVSGAIALNQAAGLANQQVNTMTLLH
ncbi:MAG: hypothetical protein ACREP6_03030 [Candidatus Binataceae bacterium]